MIYKVKVNSNGVCNYYDFIRREGLSLAIWFDIVESAFGENIHTTVKIFANVHHRGGSNRKSDRSMFAGLHQLGGSGGMLPRKIFEI